MSAITSYPGHESLGTSPVFRAITPNDSADLTGGMTRAIYVGGDGNLAVHDHAGNAVTFTAVKAGTLYGIRTTRVMSTNTTATSLVGMF